MKKAYSKISIVTPSLNEGEFIEDAILSVLNQEYDNFEHIIIDGGSTDGTLDILRKYSHLIWISEPDKGQSEALNKGFKMARGEIIGWLNADDYYLPGAFMKVREEFDKSYDVDIIYGDFIMVDENKNFIRKRKEIDFDGKILLFHLFVPTTTTFFRSNVVKNYKIDISYDYTMDKEYFYRLYTSGYKFKHFKYFVAAFRLSGKNKSTKWRSKQMEETLEIVERYYVKGSYIRKKIYPFLIFISRNYWRFKKIVQGCYKDEIKYSLKQWVKRFVWGER